MQSFKAFVIKEFYHLFRDRKTAVVLFGMPLLQLLLFGFAIRNDIQEIRLGVYDKSRDVVTRDIVSTFVASHYFVLVKELHSQQELEQAFTEGSIAEALVFEHDFASRLIKDGKAAVFVITDGSNPNISKIITGYTTSVLQRYRNTHYANAGGVALVPLMMFNPELKSVYLFVPGLMALILMLVSALMTSISITREKESGTMEVLLVSSLRPVEIIVGKVVPYLLLSLVNVLTVVAVAALVFGVPCCGSFVLLIAESLLFILTALSLGIFISTITNSQQVAMMIALGLLLLPTVLLSGFIFPVASMPLPLQILSNIIPAKWYLIIVRGIMLKGVGFSVLWKESIVLVAMTVLLLSVSVHKFKTRLE